MPIRCRRIPSSKFERWFSEICEIDPDAPNAVSLATASRLGVPSVRTVLMKIYDVNGFVFFTNYSSRKAKDLEENPRARRCSFPGYARAAR